MRALQIYEKKSYACKVFSKKNSQICPQKFNPLITIEKQGILFI